MKPLPLIILNLLISFSNLFAQNPTWINQQGSMNYTFSKYSLEGYNELAYHWQSTLLKGDVQSCIISEKVTDASLVVSHKYKQYYGKISYNMEFAYNDFKQLKQLSVNQEKIEYKRPKTITNIRKESLSWRLGQLQTRAYWLEGECELFIQYFYDDQGRIQQEQWNSIYQSAQEIILFPFEVQYNYADNGFYTIKGVFKEDFDTKEGITKYLMEFNSTGQLIKRTIYNRDLRAKKPTETNDTEVYTYTYDKKGYLTAMTYQKGTNSATQHYYQYTNYDAMGNWQIQQVLNAKQEVLFEMERQLVYNSTSKE